MKAATTTLSFLDRESGPPERRLVQPAENVCGISRRGFTRLENEDDFDICANGTILIVTDGIGGQTGGRAASLMVIESLKRTLDASWTLLPAGDMVGAGRLLNLAFGEAQRQVRQTSGSNGAWRRMGCAATVAGIRDSRLYTCNAGDVRCYVLSGSGFRQLTWDHSAAAELARANGMPLAEVRFHPQQGELTQAIGRVGGIKPDLGSYPLRRGDRVLVCSDGLWVALSHEEMAAILGSEGSVRQLAIVLSDRAMTDGSDDVTLVVYEHR